VPKLALESQGVDVLEKPESEGLVDLVKGSDDLVGGLALQELMLWHDEKVLSEHHLSVT
jgi:hypothetical protein